MSFERSEPLNVLQNSFIEMPKIPKRFNKVKSSYQLNFNKIVLELHTVKISFKTQQILNPGKVLNRQGQFYKKIVQ